jgi:hypothetical protein
MVIRSLKYLWPLLFCLLLSACIFHSAPPDNVEFQPVESLKDFEGVFRNLGERGPGEKPVYLSYLIWNSREIPHHTITTIEVRVPDADSLIVRALRNGQVEKEDTFIRERDFKIRNGRIQLGRQWALLNYGGDDPTVGPRYEIYEMGLDAKGDGKYRSRASFAGLIFMLFPAAISSSDEVRFIKLEP